MITKWRGIPTTSIKKHEDKAITKINRFNQKTIKLPRIDDQKRWAGYPGITGISKKLALLIPRSFLYVEPFAGTAKVFQEIFRINTNWKLQKFILNDKSKFVYEWLKKELDWDNTTILNLDFKEVIQTFDDLDTIFVIDQPWFRGSYKQDFSCFDRDSIKDYDNEIIALCKKIEGKFIITTRKENKIMLQSGFNNYLLESEYVVCGKYPKVLLTTNFIIKSKLVEVVS